MYKVLITTSGTGSRLHHLTKSTNKALVKINNKIIIDAIISSYPEDIELVFTLGYLGEAVKEYLTTNYPNRKMTFKNVDKFDGLGSSLGYSMLQAKDSLDCPFIFHCNDTIVSEKIPSPEEFNWDGISNGDNKLIFNTSNYSSVKIANDEIITIQDKHAKDYDYLHIGLVGIKDYEYFWNTLEFLYKSNPNNQSLNDCAVLKSMINENYIIKPIIFQEWIDTGNLESFKLAKQKIK